MKKLILASANSHKIKEFGAMLPGYEVVSLKDIGFTEDIIEDGETCAENAKIKAYAVQKYCVQNGIEGAIIADDTGLFVNALGGEPGVHSARYAGNHNDEANRQKLLEKLNGSMDRTAYFETVICYLSNSEMKLFVGRTFGNITTEKHGSDAFGYDCLFRSVDLNKTFGEATEEEKDAVSHRGRAVAALKQWLDNNTPNFDRTVSFNK